MLFQLLAGLAVVGMAQHNKVCSGQQSFQMNPGAVAAVSDLPTASSRCTISAKTHTLGVLCLVPIGNEVEFCFVNAATGAKSGCQRGLNPSLKMDKPAGITGLQITNLNGLCSLSVSNFEYCCTPSDGIQSLTGGKLCLDLPGGNLQNGNRLWLWDCTGDTNQQWWFRSNGQVISMLNSRKCVDLPGNNQKNGNQLWIWDCIDGAKSQQWGFDKHAKTLYLRSSTSDATKCVDANGGGQTVGAAAQIWDCLGNANQLWQTTEFPTVASSSNLTLV